MSYDNVWKYDTIRNYDNEADSAIYKFEPQWEHTQVLIKKDDGAVFKIKSKEVWPYDYDFIDSEADIQVDYKGNVYLCKRVFANGRIYKIYTHGKEIYLEQINRNDMYVDPNWLVDRQGNVWINDTYARLASGEFTRAPGSSDLAFIAYGDSEGFYSCHQNNKNMCVLYYMQAEAPEMQWKEHKELGKYEPGISRSEVFVYKDKTIAFAQGRRYRLIIKNRDDIQKEELTDLDPMFYEWGFEYYGDRHPCTEKYMYKFTDQEVWRLNIETCEVELLYDFGKEYIIKDFKVKNNFITCNAFELRKGNDVVLEIYEDKTVHLVESVNNDKIIYLERLN